MDIEDDFDLEFKQEIEEIEEINNKSIIDTNYAIFNIKDTIPNILKRKKEKTDNEEVLKFYKYKCFMYEELTKLDAYGKLQIWSILMDLNNNTIVIKWGQIRGKIQELILDITLNKTSRDYFEQGLIVMNSKYRDKIRKNGYEPPNLTNNMKSCMLAYKYSDNKNKVRYPTAVTTKIDGVRLLVRFKNGKLWYRSRGNKFWHNLSDIFDENIMILLKYLDDFVEIDGELYTEKVSFQVLTGLIKRDVNFDKKLFLKAKIKYHIFDINLKIPYENRYILLFNAFKNYLNDIKNLGIKNNLKLLNTFWVKNEIQLEKYFKISIEKGYEGIMVRRLFFAEPNKKGWELSIYNEKRSFGLLKYKAFYEDEAKILDIIMLTEGTSKGTAQFYVIYKGKKFELTAFGNMEERKQIYKDRKKYIGKMVTFKYASLSADGIPQHAIAKAIRDYE